jgi:hypothetical protein
MSAAAGGQLSRQEMKDLYSVHLTWMVAALSVNHSKKALLWTDVREMIKVRVKAVDTVLAAMRPADHARQRVLDNAVNPITV